MIFKHVKAIHKMNTASKEDSWRHLGDLKIDVPYDSAKPLLRIYPNGMKSAYERAVCTIIFIVAQFTTAKLWDQHRLPSAGNRIKKMWHKCTVKYYSEKKN